MVLIKECNCIKVQIKGKEYSDTGMGFYIETTKVGLFGTFDKKRPLS